MRVHIPPMWTVFRFAGTRPCPLTYNKTCLEEAGQSTEGGRSYHLETKDGIKEMRGTLGLTHTNTHIQPSGTSAAFKARGRLIDLELTRALLLNREGHYLISLDGVKSLVNDVAIPKGVKFTQSGLFGTFR